MGLVETDVVSCSACGSDSYRPVVRTRDYAYATCENDFEYVRCARCKHVYLRNRPRVSELERIYPPHYLAYNLESQLGRAVNRLRDHVQLRKMHAFRRYLRPGDTVIEVGCGTGDLLEVLRRRGDPTWRLLGVELSDQGVAALRRRRIAAIQERFETLRYDGPPAGIVIMNQVIEHLAEPKAVCQKAFDILRPGGVIFIETPSPAGWDATWFESRYWGGWHAPRHFHVFNEESLSRLLAGAGLQVVQVDYILSPYLWSHTLQCVVREKLGWPRLARALDVGNPIALSAVSAVDVIQRLARGKTSNMRMIAAKPVDGETWGTPR